MDLGCQYASKPCGHPRSVKPDGELHRLCLFHRMRANAAQCRWQTKKKQTDPIIETVAAAREVSRRPMSRVEAIKRKRQKASSQNMQEPSHQRRRHATKRSTQSKYSSQTSVMVSDESMRFSVDYESTPTHVVFNDQDFKTAVEYVISDQDLEYLRGLLVDLDG